MGFVEPFVCYLDEPVSIEHPIEDPAEDNDGTPALRTALGGAYPNPFNPMTTIKFSLGRDPERAPQRARPLGPPGWNELVNGRYDAGDHTVVWQGQDSAGRSAPSGNYMLYMVTDEGIPGTARCASSASFACSQGSPGPCRGPPLFGTCRSMTLAEAR